MPRGDRTGPNGQGPMTGRGMGFCRGFNTPGFMNQGFGRGRGFGRGFGRAMVMQPQIQEIQMTQENEAKILEQELKEIELEKKEIQKRLKELSTK